MRQALIVVDMVDDFVLGKFGSPGAKATVPVIQDLISNARNNDVPVIFLNDHHKEGDFELNVWGPHAMQDSKGSEIVRDLLPEPEDIVIKKQVYSGFFNTDLQRILEESKIGTLFFTGVSTDICVQHNVAEAFYRGFKIYVITDGTAAIDNQVHDSALDYMKKIYGAEPIDSKKARDLFEKQD